LTLLVRWSKPDKMWLVTNSNNVHTRYMLNDDGLSRLLDNHRNSTEGVSKWQLLKIQFSDAWHSSWKMEKDGRIVKRS
jgi:hypothetical protein